MAKRVRGGRKQLVNVRTQKERGKRLIKVDGDVVEVEGYEKTLLKEFVMIVKSLKDCGVAKNARLMNALVLYGMSSEVNGEITDMTREGVTS